MLQTS